MQKIQKENESKGITLIALIITIIVMLILAGVAMSMISADGGLFTKTREAKEKYNNGVSNESKTIDDLMGMLIDVEEGKYSIKPETATNGDVTIELHKIEGYTLEYKDEQDWEEYESEIIVNENKTIYMRLKDETGKIVSTQTINITNIDKEKPNAFDLSAKVTPSSTEVKPYSITVSGSTTDKGSTGTAEKYIGIRGYQFQLKNSDGTVKVDWTEEQADTTFNFTISEHNLEIGKTYKVSMRAVDKAGNEPTEATNNDTEIFFSLIGAYVNYDAGVWTQEDLNLITASEGSPKLHSTVNDATTGNQTLPNTQGQFGGFEIGQSRNSNSTPFILNGITYAPKTSGWRVWSIDETSGEITIVHAGHSETYYHAETSSGYSEASKNILLKRNCKMYENSYAKPNTAHIMTGQDAVEWYNDQFGTNYTVIENGTNNSTFNNAKFLTLPPIEVLANGSFYWIASSWDYRHMHYIASNSMGGNYNRACRCTCTSYSKIRNSTKFYRWKGKCR